MSYHVNDFINYYNVTIPPKVQEKTAHFIRSIYHCTWKVIAQPKYNQNSCNAIRKLGAGNG